MSILRNDPLRLPGRALGPQDTAFDGLGGPHYVYPTVARSWAGRPVGLLADRLDYPVLWTLGALAHFMGVAEADFAALSATQLLAAPTGRHSTRVPRALLYQDQEGIYAGVGDAAADLQAAGVLAAKGTFAEFGFPGPLQHPFVECPLTLIVPPMAIDTTSDHIVLDDPTLGHSEFDSVFPLPGMATPGDFVGGECLFLTSAFWADGAYWASETNSLYQDNENPHSNLVSSAQALFLAWRGRYARLKVVVLGATIDTGDPDDAAAAAYNRAQAEAASGAYPEVVHLHLGDFPDAASAAPSFRTEAESQARAFFGL